MIEEKIIQLQCKLLQCIKNKNITYKELRRFEYEVCLLEHHILNDETNSFWC